MMGFSLELFFDELFEVLDSDMKAARKVRKLMAIIIAARTYAKECGMLKENSNE